MFRWLNWLLLYLLYLLLSLYPLPLGLPLLFTAICQHIWHSSILLYQNYTKKTGLCCTCTCTSIEPAFAPVPAPAHYSHLPADLAWQVAALPPLIEHGRGRGRGRGRRNNTTFPAPAPLPFSEIAAQYAALPSVCWVLFVSLRQS